MNLLTSWSATLDQTEAAKGGSTDLTGSGGARSQITVAVSGSPVMAPW
jgi:hypothetical protein